jgi:hypothetical protein
MKPIQLDPHHLLGFRLEARDTVDLDGNVKIKSRLGIKLGAKIGGKPDQPGATV